MQMYKNRKDKLKKESQVERLAQLDIKIYYKVTVIKAMFNSTKLDKQADGSEADLHNKWTFDSC